jgi:hypothetical protein
MTFDEMLAQVRELLQNKGRQAYPALKLRFGVDDTYLEALKAELINAEHVAADENGKVLVWAGASPVPSSRFQVPSQDSELRTLPCELHAPHLAERIRAGQAALETRGSTEGERKTITAFFAALRGVRCEALGDGIFALFGAPIAHEDHPQRALYAALRMQEEMRRYADTLRAKGYPPLLMRGGSRGIPCRAAG